MTQENKNKIWTVADTLNVISEKAQEVKVKEEKQAHELLVEKILEDHSDLESLCSKFNIDIHDLAEREAKRILETMSLSSIINKYF